jgi:calcium-translocating P-type ATPase
MTEAHGSGSVPWHALPADDVIRRLETSETGLTREDVAARLARHGPNVIEESRPPSDLAILIHQFRSPLIYILLLAAAVTIVLGEYIDAGVIAAVLALNALIGFIQERQAERSVRALIGLVAPHAVVMRDGRESEVDSSELVPGDIVALESGRRVPADLRLLTATSLTIDESLLTGESVPVTKRTAVLDPDAPVAERHDMAYSGAVVAMGRGRGVVVETGATTQLGRIATSIREEESRETPLQQRMNRFARIIGLIVALSSVAAIAIGLALGRDLGEMFLVAVALAVAAIPEGLPVVFTITLALGVRRMARRRAIVRRLPAVETLGSTTVIGSDKTGTLTQNRMTVTEIWTPAGSFEVPHTGEDEVPKDGPLMLALVTGVLTNEAVVYRSDDGFEMRGDPTEAALLVAAHHFGEDPEHHRRRMPAVAEAPFEPERQYSASWRRDDRGVTLYVKGAPERILEMADSLEGASGPEPLDRERVLDAAHQMASRGLRVLAMAYRRLPDDHPEVDPAAPHEPARLTLVGLQGLMDPPRDGVKDAIAGCRRAGVRVVMITGDHAATARAIAAQLGITDGSAAVLTGVELERLSDDELYERARDVAVYARVSPDQKLRIVRALQAIGEVVAVTGDGVNDAPALKAAEIGVAMGRDGTDIAREASDIVLTDDDFVSIYAAVEEGRVTFDNLRKVTFFLISTGAASIVIILVALLAGWPLPLLPAQLLWLNLVTNGLQDVAMAFEPGEPDAALRPPRPRSEGVISALLWERTLISGLVIAAGTLLLFRWQIDAGSSLEAAQTVALTTMVLFQAFQAGNARSDTRSLARMSPFSNRFLFLSVVGALIIHALATLAEPTQFILRVVPLDPPTWIVMTAVASSLVIVVEIHKAFRRRFPWGEQRRRTMHEAGGLT